MVEKIGIEPTTVILQGSLASLGTCFPILLHLNGLTPGLALENAHTFQCGTFFGSLSQQALVHPDFA